MLEETGPQVAAKAKAWLDARRNLAEELPVERISPLYLRCLQGRGMPEKAEHKWSPELHRRTGDC